MNERSDTRDNTKGKQLENQIILHAATVPRFELWSECCESKDYTQISDLNRLSKEKKQLSHHKCVETPTYTHTESQSFPKLTLLYNMQSQNLSIFQITMTSHSTFNFLGFN